MKLPAKGLRSSGGHSRYACYLVVQNADPSKEIVALGQTYKAVEYPVLHD